jgi:hypothetical protein
MAYAPLTIAIERAAESVSSEVFSTGHRRH